MATARSKTWVLAAVLLMALVASLTAGGQKENRER